MIPTQQGDWMAWIKRALWRRLFKSIIPQTETTPPECFFLRLTSLSYDAFFLRRYNRRERERANHSPRWPNETPLRPFRALLYKKLIKLAFSAAAWKHGWNGVWHANNVFVGACKHLKRVVKIYIDFWCLSDCFKKKYSANWNWQLAIRLKSNCAYRKSGELTEKSEVCNRLCPEVEIVA